MQFRKSLLLTEVFLFLLAASSVGQVTYQSDSIMIKMFNAVDNIDKISFDFRKIERIDNKYDTARNSVKMQMKPRKIYLKTEEAGQEIIYEQGKRNGDVLVNPNAFPYVNLELDPYGSILRSNNHHTIFEVGLNYFPKVARSFLRKVNYNYKDRVLLDSITTWNYRRCAKLIASYHEFRIIQHTVKKGETITSIADSLNLSDYYILYLNDNIDSYDDVDEGDVIKIPNLYCDKMIIYVDLENYLPICQKIYIGNLLYEQYEYTHIHLNPYFDSDTFSEDNDEYGF